MAGMSASARPHAAACRTCNASRSRSSVHRVIQPLHTRSLVWAPTQQRTGCNTRIGAPWSKRVSIAQRAAEEEAYTISLPLEIRSAQGYQLAGFISEPTDASFNTAITTYMKDLRKEQEADQAMSRAIAEDASAEDWEKDPVLLRRMAAVREAERGEVLQELLYLICLRKLLCNGNIFVSDLQQLTPGAGEVPATLVQQQDLAGDTLSTAAAAAAAAAAGQDGASQEEQQPGPGLMTPAAADALVSYVANTLGSSMAASPAETPLSIDRVQAARLYAGFVEFGYFTRRLEALCQDQGLDLSGSSEQMIAHANTLPDDQLAGFCAVQSADGWFAAVRHIGGLFQLPPNQDPYDALGLPYPCLETTLSSLQLEPAANVWEHFSPPGSAAELAARARDKQSRGWNVDPSELEPQLPEADLLHFELGIFKRLLLEAGLFGVLLRDAEGQLQEGGYQLGSLEQRREHAGQPTS